MLAQPKPRWELPNPEALAKLVNVVTTTMLRIRFEVAGQVSNPATYTRMAAIDFGGEHPLRIALASDDAGCHALCKALFGCEADSLEPWMIDDALCELCNMAAGQIKNAMAPGMLLTVPKVITPPVLPSSPEGGRQLVLRAVEMHLLLSISTQ